MKKICILLALLLALCSTTVPANAEGKVYLVQFKDYDEMDLNWTAVHTFVDSGIVKGFPESMLMPDKSVTREQLAALISRAKIPAPESKGNASFSDVNSLRWSYNEVKAAGLFFTDILSSKNRFEPQKEMTREEFFSVLVRANGYGDQDLKETSPKNPPPDFSEVSQKLKPLIALAIDKNLMVLDETGKINPKQTVKRADAIGLVYMKLYFDQLAFKVNGVSVSMGEFMFQRTQRKSLVVKQNMNSGKDFVVQTVIDDAAKYARDYIVARITIEQKASELGLTLTPEEKKEIEDFIPEKVKGFGSDAEYNKHLWYNCYTRQVALTNVTRDMLYQKASEKTVENIAASDADVAKYYNDNINVYRTRQMYKTKQIVLKTVDDARKELPADAQEAARKKAEEVLLKAKNGDDFESLVKEYSEDKFSANIGGQLIFGHGDVEKGIEDTVTALQPGQVGGPAKVTDGYHILKLEEIIPEKVTTLEEAKENIRTFLTPQMRQKAFDEKCKKWQDEAKIEYAGVKF